MTTRSVVGRATAALAALGLVASGFAGAATPAAAAPPFHCNQVNMHPNQLVNGQVGVPYSDVISLTPANAFFYDQWAMSPTPVAGGLLLVPNPNNTINDATIQGTPATAGTYAVTVTGGGIYVHGTICKVTTTYTLVIAP